MRKTQITGSKRGCHLRRRDIEDLILTSCRDVEDKNPTISTEQDNVVISGKTLSELEDEAGHPKRLTNIKIHLYATQRSVYVSIAADQAYYRVEGSDSTWANGRFAEVKQILKKTQSRFLWAYHILNRFIIYCTARAHGKRVSSCYIWWRSNSGPHGNIFVRTFNRVFCRIVYTFLAGTHKFNHSSA